MTVTDIEDPRTITASGFDITVDLLMVTVGAGTFDGVEFEEHEFTIVPPVSGQELWGVYLHSDGTMTDEQPAIGEASDLGGVVTDPFARLADYGLSLNDNEFYRYLPGA